MAYENCGVVVIITKRLVSNLRSRFPDTARSSQKCPTQQTSKPSQGLSYRQKSILSCPSLRNAQGALDLFAKWIGDLSAALFSHTHGRYKAEVSYNMAQEVSFQASHPLTVYRATSCFSSRFVRSPEVAMARPPGLPETCPKSSESLL